MSDTLVMDRIEANLSRLRLSQVWEILKDVIPTA
jgi:hypothetical protein